RGDELHDGTGARRGERGGGGRRQRRRERDRARGRGRHGEDDVRRAQRARVGGDRGGAGVDRAHGRRQRDAIAERGGEARRQREGAGQEPVLVAGGAVERIAADRELREVV